VSLAGGEETLRARIAGVLADDSISPSPNGGTTSDVVILAFDLRANDRVADLRDAVRALPVPRFVVVSPGAGPFGARRAVREGAAGIVLEADIEQTLAAAVRAVAAGLTAIPLKLRGVAEKVPLSHRELEVLRLVAKGKSNGEIALALCLAESTVKSHLSSLFRKLGAGSRKEVARLALDPDEGLSHLVVQNGASTPFKLPLSITS
jgi:DNA-binding NarL/FixJ family response regulator